MRGDPKRRGHPHRPAAACRRTRGSRTAPSRCSSATCAATSGDGLAVVLHGGAWKATYNLVHIGHLCVALRDAGIATFNVEYRRVGDPGGGWPGSLEDVLLAVEYARGLATRLVLVGHSAGGHLALLAAAQLRVPVVAIAAVSDPATLGERRRASVLRRRAARRGIAARASAARRAAGARARHARTTPCRSSSRCATRRRRSGEAELITLEGAGHFEPIDPQSPESAGRARRRRAAARSLDGITASGVKTSGRGISAAAVPSHSPGGTHDQVPFGAARAPGDRRSDRRERPSSIDHARVASANAAGTAASGRRSPRT